MEEDHESTCQQGVLVSLHELNMVDSYRETVRFTTRHYSKRPPDYHCYCVQTLRRERER